MRRAFRLESWRSRPRDVDEELAFHIQTRVQELVAGGMAEDAARAEALRKFGDVARVREDCVTLDEERNRSIRRADLLDDLRQDIAFAVRTLHRNAGFAAIVIISLAVGIGANASIFSLVDAVLLRPLPVTRPRELIVVGSLSRVSGLSSGDGVRGDIFSAPAYLDARAENHSVTGLAASGRAGRLDVVIGSPPRQAAAVPDAQAGTPAAPEHPSGRFVSANYFSVLGVGAAAGRIFDGTEDRAEGAAPVAVASDGYWQQRFARDPGVVGRTITVNGAAVTIIGVAQRGFDGELIGAPISIFMPLSLQPVLVPHQPLLRTRALKWLTLIGRLKPGVTIEAAHTDFSAVLRRSYLTHVMGTATPTEEQVRQLDVLVASGARGISAVRRTYEGPLRALTVGVALVLLIICANVANLFLARTAARTREISVRLAIGAGRMRLVRQLLTESAVVAAIGGGAALALAWWGSKLLLTLEADGSRAVIPIDVRLNVPELAFTMALSLGAVLLFGLAPALRGAQTDLATAMRASTRSSVGAGGRGRRPSFGMMLVGAQVTLSVVLLVASSLLVQNLRRIENADVGLDRDHLLIADVDAARIGYKGNRMRAVASALRAKLASIPGVAAVSYSENGIFSGTESSNNIQVPGFTAREAADSAANTDDVGPGYVAAIGGRLVAGRDIEERDVRGAEKVMLVNEAFARFYFRDGRPVLGTTVSIDDTTKVAIVGVVSDTKDHSLVTPPVRRFYIPWQQAITGEATGLRLEVRAARDPAALTKAVREAIIAVDPQLPIDALAPLTAAMRASVREQRLLMRLASGFGVLALLLCAVGLYGVLTYAIVRRTGEIGLRVALGATRPAIIRMVVGDASRVVVVGVAAGLPLAYLCARLMHAELDQVSPVDPKAIAAALGTLGLAALTAVLVPALRASRVAPVEALRAE